MKPKQSLNKTKQRTIYTLIIIALLCIIIYFVLLRDRAIINPLRNYKLDIEKKQINDNKLILIFRTDIPGNFNAIVSVNLLSQKPNDVWIWKDSRIRITDGYGDYIINKASLPQGLYTVKILFNFAWDDNKDIFIPAINKAITREKNIYIEGSRETSEKMQMQLNGRRWVMENIAVGSEWNESYWKSNFGDCQILEVKRWNPRIIRACYYESIDMTIFINMNNNTITHYRMGKENS